MALKDGKESTTNPTTHQTSQPTTTPATAGYFDVEKPIVRPDSAAPDYDPSLNAKPCSPFYNYDVARPSVDQSKTPSETRVRLVEIDTNDLEAGQTTTSKSSLDAAKQERVTEADGSLKFWPCRLRQIMGMEREQKQGYMCQARPRRKQWLPGLTKGQRLAVKLMIALVIVGALVGIGVGISLAVGGGVYKNRNSTSPIGD